MPAIKSLDEIYKNPNPRMLEYELRKYVASKELDYKQKLTEAESVFDEIVRMGGRIACDGFVSLYNQSLTPESFTKVCNALTEVGGIRLRDLLHEAWSIYTNDKHAVTLDELRRIPSRRFNTKQKMDRFDQIGEEVIKEFEQELVTGKVWSVEYAKLHRDEFEPIKK